MACTIFLLLLGFTLQVISYWFVVFLVGVIKILPIYYSGRFSQYLLLLWSFILCCWIFFGIHLQIMVTTNYHLCLNVGIVHTRLKLVEDIYRQFRPRECTHCSWLSGWVRILWDWKRGRRLPPHIPLFFTLDLKMVKSVFRDVLGTEDWKILLST